jgi:hypothetical protein
MVLSGIAMVVFDSRVIHNALKKIRNKFRRNQEQQLELGPDSSQVISQDIQRVDNPEVETSASGVNQRQATDDAGGSEADSNQTVPRVRAENVIVPYSIKVGLLIFAVFLVIFVVIMVLRGVLTDAPLLFRFFANIYLAGMPSS